MSAHINLFFTTEVKYITEIWLTSKNSHSEDMNFHSDKLAVKLDS